MLGPVFSETDRLGVGFDWKCKKQWIRRQFEGHAGTNCASLIQHEIMHSEHLAVRRMAHSCKHCVPEVAMGKDAPVLKQMPFWQALLQTM